MRETKYLLAKIEALGDLEVNNDYLATKLSTSLVILSII